MLFSTGVMLVGLLMTLFTSLWLIFAGMLLFPADSLPRTPWQAVGLGHGQNALKARPLPYICSVIIWDPALLALGGVFWHSYGWSGVGGFIALMLVLALLVSTRLHHRLHV